MKSSIYREYVTVAVDSNMRRHAKQFAAEQMTVAKGKQVYLNTIAVCAVSRYLSWLSISSSLSDSDCWQANLRSIFNLADLVLPDLGCLECRLVIGDLKEIEIDRSPKDDCLGYIIVSLDRELANISILGFLATHRITEEVQRINLDSLQSLDILLETIERHKTVHSLKLWWVDRFQSAWQQPELLLSHSGSYFRSLQDNLSHKLQQEDIQLRRVSRGKIITFDRDDRIDNNRVVLVLVISEISPLEYDICMRLYPDIESNTLPAKLRLELWDYNNNLCMEAEARERDSCLELQFSCHSGEEFSIKIKLDDRTEIESFVI